jgi:hypothetical protein
MSIKHIQHLVKNSNDCHASCQLPVDFAALKHRCSSPLCANLLAAIVRMSMHSSCCFLHIWRRIVLPAGACTVASAAIFRGSQNRTWRKWVAFLIKESLIERETGRPSPTCTMSKFKTCSNVGWRSTIDIVRTISTMTVCDVFPTFSTCTFRFASFAH